jgi:TM2 domain-containing membrane protein YozV
MEQQKVDMFIMNNSSKLPENQVALLREKLLKVDDEKWFTISSIQFKDPMTALILSLFLGNLGIDRFYLGHTGLGVGKLLTCGGAGIWTLIDWFMIMGATREENAKKLLNNLL